MKSVLFPYIVDIIMPDLASICVINFFCNRFGSIISRLSLYAGRGFLVGRGGGEQMVKRWILPLEA